MTRGPNYTSRSSAIFKGGSGPTGALCWKCGTGTGGRSIGHIKHQGHDDGR